MSVLKNQKIYKFILFDLDGTLLGCHKVKLNIFLIIFLYNQFAPHFGFFKTLQLFFYGFKSLNKQKMKILPETSSSILESLIQDLSLGTEIPYLKIQYHLDQFYKKDFEKLLKFFYPLKGSKILIENLLQEGYKLAIVTNPVWPKTCNQKRVELLGLNLNSFELITHSENMRALKPSPLFYLDCLSLLCAKPEECYLIGDSFKKDYPATFCGIDVFLLKRGFKDKFIGMDYK